MSVQDNIGFGLNYGTPGEGLSREQREERVRHFVNLVGLTGSEKKYPHQLSGGMRQRVALARLLANEPDILLMDEPLGALDAQTRLILQVELLRIWGETSPIDARKTALFITHDIEEAVFLADRVVVMSTHPGRVKAVIPVDLPRPRTEHIRGEARFGELVEQIWQLIKRRGVPRYRRQGAGDGVAAALPRRKSMSKTLQGFNQGRRDLLLGGAALAGGAILRRALRRTRAGQRRQPVKVSVGLDTVGRAATRRSRST